MFSDHSEVTLKISNKKENPQTLNNTVLNNLWIKEEVSRKRKQCIEMNNNENISNSIGYR